MSKLPAVTQSVVGTIDAAKRETHPYEDEQMRRFLRRNQVVAATLARMKGLNPSLVGDTIEETQANVEAVGLTLATYGSQLNAQNVNMFDQIPPGSGQMVPRTQLLMALVSELTGDEIWSDETNDAQSATVYLRRQDTGRVHKATYTIEQARRSHALDFWFARWEKSSSGKSYIAEKVVIGTDEAEVYSSRDSWPSWAKGEPQCNPAWHHFREDMLERRAFKRVIKVGRPGITAGVLAFDRPGVLPPPPGATITVNMDFDDDAPALGTGESEWDADGPAEHPEIATDPVPPPVEQAAIDGGRRLIRLRKQIDALPSEWRERLAHAWTERKIPPIPHPNFAGRMDEAEDLVDEITTTAFSHDVAGADSGEAAGHVPAAAGSIPASGDVRAQAPATAHEPARPLAQQIAIQAQRAGLDHHHVIEAVTLGDKQSAKEVDNEEGELVLKAIADLAAGKYRLVEKDGRWTFADPPTDPNLFADDDPGRPFD